MNIIKRIMIIFSISFLIPIIVMVIHLTAYEHNSTVQQYKEKVNSVLTDISKMTDNYTEDLKRHVLENSENPDFKLIFSDKNNSDYQNRVKLDINNIVNYSDCTENAAIVSLDGTVISAYKSLTDYYYIPYDTLADVRDSRNAIVDFNFIKNGSDVYFAAYAPIIDNDVVCGYYMQMFNSSYLETLMSAFITDKTDFLSIIDMNNNLLSPNNFYNLGENIQINQSENFANKFQKSAAWVPNQIYSVDFVSSDNKKMQAMLVRDEDTNLCFVYSYPNSVFHKKSKSVMYIIVSYLVVILIILAVICVKLRKSLNNSFNEVFKTIEIYEMGDWTYRPKLDSDDEFGVMARSLWKLAQTLSQMYMNIKFNEYRYKLAMEFSSDLIFDYDLNKNIFESDRKKWNQLFPFAYMKNEKKIAEEFMKIIHPDDAETFKNYRKQLFQDCYNELEKQSSIEFRMRLADDAYHWIERKDVLVKGVGENIEHIIGTLGVIDERKNSELALKQKATIDTLTGLYNRFTFINKANEALVKSNLLSAAIIFVDLDDFKFINDTYGHEAGDNVLSFVGKTIHDVTLNNGFGGRYGGDEFLLFLNDKSIATQVADKILATLAKDFTVRGTNSVIKIHSSIGIAMYKDHDTTVDGLIKKADNAMYYSKKHGKNRYTIFDINKGDYESEAKS